jgi:hypothetical protein
MEIVVVNRVRELLLDDLYQILVIEVTNNILLGTGIGICGCTTLWLMRDKY